MTTINRRNFVKKSTAIAASLSYLSLNEKLLFAANSGEVYLFYRPLVIEIPHPILPFIKLTVDLGHVGWGFLLDPVRKIYCYRATENYSGQAKVPVGSDNGAWIETGSYAKMMNKMRSGFRLNGHSIPAYNSFLKKSVSNFNGTSAQNVGRANISRGYLVTGLPGNNCGDHAWDVLNAYGAAPVLIPGSPSAWCTLLQTQGWQWYSSIPAVSEDTPSTNPIPTEPSVSISDSLSVFAATRNEFLEKNSQMRTAGKKLDQVQAYVINGKEYWNGVWEVSDARDQAVFGWARQDFVEKNRELEEQGWMLHRMQGYIYNGIELFNAIWRPKTINNKWVVGYARQDFVNVTREMAQNGYELHVLESYMYNNQELWNGVWYQQNTGKTWVMGYGRQDFLNINTSHTQNGVNLLYSQAFINHRGQELWNGLWNKGPKAATKVYGYGQKDFYKVHREMMALGKKITHIQAYDLRGASIWNGIWI